MNEGRDEGWYWVSWASNPTPQVAQWDGRKWWLVALSKPIADDKIVVLKDIASFVEEK